MPTQALVAPRTDPAILFELFRGSYATELLVAAVAHLNVFGLLARQPLSWAALRDRLELADRPAHVLITALRAMGLLLVREDGSLALAPLAAEHLVPGGPFDVSDYLGLAAQSPGVLTMVERLRTNRPAGTASNDRGTAFIFREGIKSAMEEGELARHFTLALAGRARNVAPAMAERLPLSRTSVLLDVGGGTGIYSIALLYKNPRLRAIVFDRPEVLRVAAEFADSHGVAERLECVAGDMFSDPLPAADTILLSNVLHDWDILECQQLIARCATRLPLGGQLVIHDVFLHDDLGGPLSLALYSAALFSLTEGRAYSAGEYSAWLRSAGLVPEAPLATLAHCELLVAEKRFELAGRVD